MIDITKLTTGDVGREVVYTAYEKTEYGRITSWNDSIIFVRYHTRRWHSGGEVEERTGSTSEATRPTDLEFA